MTATPASGFVFIGWRGVDCTGGIGAVCVLHPDVDTTATAVFAIASVTTTEPPTTTTATTRPTTTRTTPTVTGGGGEGGGGGGGGDGDGPPITAIPPAPPVPIPKPARPLWAALQKTVAAQLHIGSIAFNTPTTIHRGSTAEIVFLLSPEQSVKRLKEQISEAGDREGARVQVSDYMEADLDGRSFSITRIGSARHLVLPNRTTRWAWEVTPLQTGVLHLHLTLTAILTTNGESRELEIRTFEKTLTIRVPWSARVKDFVQGNWNWLWTAIVVPLGAWTIRWQRQARRKAAEPPVDV